VVEVVEFTTIPLVLWFATMAEVFWIVVA
jgi:hypothetical protein